MSGWHFVLPPTSSLSPVLALATNISYDHRLWGGGVSARPGSHIGSCHSVLGAQSSGLVAHCAVMSTQIRNHYLLRNLHSFESLNFGIYLFVYKRKCIADISHYRHYIGVGDGRHLHDVLHFFETAKIASLKIQKHRCFK